MRTWSLEGPGWFLPRRALLWHYVKHGARSLCGRHEHNDRTRWNEPPPALRRGAKCQRCMQRKGGLRRRRRRLETLGA